MKSCSLLLCVWHSSICVKFRCEYAEMDVLLHRQLYRLLHINAYYYLPRNQDNDFCQRHITLLYYTSREESLKSLEIIVCRQVSIRSRDRDVMFYEAKDRPRARKTSNGSPIALICNSVASIVREDIRAKPSIISFPFPLGPT